MPMYMDKIEAFLKEVEGPQQCVGYIPCWLTGQSNAKGKPKSVNYKGLTNPEGLDPMGVSGVTIATGVDLGQTSVQALQSLGLESPIIEHLLPYIGKKDFGACLALHEKPLTIAKSEADAIDAAMHKHHASIISAKYDRDAGEHGAFEKLPWQAQVAIFSLLYQRGVNSPKKFPDVWKDLIDGDFATASKSFDNPENWNGYMDRRRKEGALLASIEGVIA